MRMRSFESVEDLSKELARVIATDEALCIGIDEKDGSAKTTLAQQISSNIHATLISVDDFVEKKRGGYVPYLRLEDLGVGLVVSQCSTNRPQTP